MLHRERQIVSFFCWCCSMYVSVRICVVVVLNNFRSIDRLVLVGVAGQLVEEAGLLVNVRSTAGVSCILGSRVGVVVAVGRVVAVKAAGAVRVLEVAELQAVSRLADLVEIALLTDGCGASTGANCRAGRGSGVVASQGCTSAGSSTCSSKTCTSAGAVAVRASQASAGSTVVVRAGEASAGGTVAVRAAKVTLAELCDLAGAKNPHHEQGYHSRQMRSCLQLCHGDGSSLNDRVDDRCLDMGLVDLLSGVVVLDALSLPLNDRLRRKAALVLLQATKG